MTLFHLQSPHLLLLQISLTQEHYQKILKRNNKLNIKTKKATGTIETYDTDQLTNEAEESTQEENWQRSNIEINPKDSDAYINKLLNLS